MATPPSEHESLRDLRRAAGLTQAELAQQLGTTQSAVARWERGAVAPSMRSVRRLADACGHRVAFEPVGDVDEKVTDEEVARLETNVRLTPTQRMARAATAANFVLRSRRAMATALDGQR